MTSKPPPHCNVCGKKLSFQKLFPLSLLHFSIYETIQEQHPHITSDGFICANDLTPSANKHKQSLNRIHKNHLSDLSKEAAQKIATHQIVSQNINRSHRERISFGNRLSDSLAYWGGSWSFLCSLLGVLFLWMILNTYVLNHSAFDPYPYIFLNLILSCLAGIQAPVIMMSQNRQEEKDRLRAENDYHVNLKSELEIRQLHTKLDHILVGQWLHNQKQVNQSASLEKKSSKKRSRKTSSSLLK